MRVLWASDAAWQTTGYGITTNHITRRMAADGHRVFNYAPGALHQGRADIAPNLTVLSSSYGDDRWGNLSLQPYITELNPDVIITWLDCQGLVNYGWDSAPTLMWAPIDTWPVPSNEIAILNRAARVLVPSRWGQHILAEQGIDAYYLPCGIDLSLFDIDPEGRERWRKQLKLDGKTFLLGMVGLNSGSPDRKAYGFAFDVIRRFAETHADFKVYIHTNPEGGDGAIDLYELRSEMGLENIIAFPPPVSAAGRGARYLRDMYNAFDVLLHAGMCEGFGLPIVEAQACGTPVVANDCSSVSELLGPSCYPAKPLADMLVATSTRIALPSVDNLLAKLEWAYDDWQAGAHNRESIRRAVRQYDQDAIYEQHWLGVLEDLPAPVRVDAGERKLVLAAGGQNKEGFVHHDKEYLWPHIAIAHDLNDCPWPFETDAWDYIEFSDCLEHLRANLTEVMDELWRITAPGGYVYIHTAEAGSWQLTTDPTHVHGFTLDSLDYFDPKTKYGIEFSYSEKKWHIHKKTRDISGGLVFILTPLKEPVHVGAEELAAVAG